MVLHGGGRGGGKIRSGAGCKRKPGTRLGGCEIRPGSAGGPGGVISVLQSLLQDSFLSKSWATPFTGVQKLWF